MNMPTEGHVERALTTIHFRSVICTIMCTFEIIQLFTRPFLRALSPSPSVPLREGEEGYPEAALRCLFCNFFEMARIPRKVP